jgi:NhaP-type Na+/H+ or K+/H+ antiporter
MQTAYIHHWELILLFLMILVASVTALARRFQIPYPIMPVIGGLIVSLIPNMPDITLNPDIVFLIILPPRFCLPLPTILHGVSFV